MIAPYGLHVGGSVSFNLFIYIFIVGVLPLKVTSLRSSVMI